MPEPDAGIVIDAAFVVAPPAPPEIPWLDLDTFEESLDVAAPAITPCPDGWREVSGECDPWPESGPADCPFGQAHFPGEPGCRSVGSACPPGDFALGLPDDGTVLFVLETAAAGGDGTRAAPYRTINDALAAATAGQTIAIGKGTYGELVVLPEGVTLAGACAAETQLGPIGGEAYSTIYTESADTAVYDLGIVNPSFTGIIASGATARMDIAGVAIAGVSGVGIVAGGATMSITDVRISRTRPRSEDGAYGSGITVQTGARVTIERAVIEESALVGIAATEAGTEIVLRDSVIRDTLGNGGENGSGVWIETGAAATIERVEIAESNQVGVAVLEGTLTLDQSLVRDTVGYMTDLWFIGAAVAVGAGTARVTRSVLRGNNTYTVLSMAEADLTLEDVVVRDTAPYVDREWGYGAMVQQNAQLTATRTVFERNHAVAARVIHTGSNATLTDVAIRDTTPTASDGTFGRGLEVLEGASAALHRARLERNRADGIFVVEGTVELEDVVVRETASQDGENDGRGITCGAGCTATASRLLLDANAAAGLVAAGGSGALTDFVVRATQDRSTGMDVSGAGLDVRDGAAVTARRVIAVDNHVAGISAAGPGTSLVLEDAVSRHTFPRGELYGIGFVAFGGASLELGRAESHDNHIGLIAVGSGTTLASTDGLFRDMQPRPSSMRGGEGLILFGGATATMTRVAIERVHGFGMAVHGGSSATIDRFRARDVLAEACGDACGGGLGIALVTQVGATVDASAFELRRAARCGVFIDASSVDLADGEIAENDIGACVRVPDYDVTRLTQNVRYRDNRVNVETVGFAVPEPEVSLDGL